MKIRVLPGALYACALLGIVLTMSDSAFAAPRRPQGPCDIYAAAQTPCVAAHSTTRALYASYNGPLYQIKRESDGRTQDIGVVQPLGSDAGGYANAAAQDAFCANTICVINVIYDQSGKGNHLLQAAPGTFKGPAKGAFDTQPIADMAPITISGHKAYGVYIIPGMGFRNNNATGLAIGDEPEGIYSVVDGTHYDSGCCFDYGNASTNGRAVGTGTMETTYFGTSTVWGSGKGTGPWIMSDMEAGLFSGHSAKQNVADPTIDSWRFVTAVVDGGGGNRWDLRGGNAQQGGLTTFYSGVRPGEPEDGRYYPMHKQGGILLGTGGDNGNGSSGTFYEGVMTTGYPTEATTDAVQANIVAARYDVERVGLSRATAFTPGSSQEVTETFTNTTSKPAVGVRLSVSVPGRGWTSVVAGSGEASKSFSEPVAAGASESAVFKVTSPTESGAGLLTGRVEWKDSAKGGMKFEITNIRVRNSPPVKINEVFLSGQTGGADQFIELYNASDKPVDISRWSLISTQSQWAPVKLVTVPSGITMAPHSFYVLALSGSGLVAPASAGASTIQVRSTSGFANGQQIDVDGELRKIVHVGSPATAMTTVFIPVSTGPRITVPAGATRLPVTNGAGFEVGQKIGIDLGGAYELAAVTAVGKAATQTTLASSAEAGSTNIKVAADTNVSVGDTITVGTGAHMEVVKAASVGEAGSNGAGIGLATPLRFGHMQGVDVSDAGTGISFLPATRFAHRSGDAVQALGSGITLDRTLTRNHAYGAPVGNTEGYLGGHAPNQLFGNPLSTSAGSIALMDGTGAVIVDAMVYGSQQSNSSANGTIASPELAVLEGDQGKGGCIVVTPGPGKSVGRYPDGADTDSNCTDFRTQAMTTLAMDAAVGALNLKVSNVDGFEAGSKIMIGTGAEQETAVIATVGTPGATTLSSAAAAGAMTLPVASAFGFRPGQTITIDDGENREMAIVANGGRRGVPAITLAAPLKAAHPANALVAGTGITLGAALVRAHGSGTQVADSLPTPGSANQYGGSSH